MKPRFFIIYPNADKKNAFSVLWNSVVLTIQDLSERGIAKFIKFVSPQVEDTNKLLADHRTNVLQDQVFRFLGFYRIPNVPNDR